MRILLLSVFLFISTKAYCGPHEEIMQVINAQKDAWNRGDIPAYMNGYWQHDSLQFITKKGITRGWKATLNKYQSSYPNKASMGQLEFSELQIKLVSYKQAIVIGRWFLRREQGDVGGYFTLVFSKQKEGWRIIIDHTS